MNRLKTFEECCNLSNFVATPEFDDWLCKNSFFLAPASIKYHGAHEGGLFDHSYAVYKRLKQLTERNNLKWQREQSPFIVGMFHDLCKCDKYVEVLSPDPRNEETGKANYIISGYEYNQNMLLEGHGSKSVMLLSQFINLTEEEMLCIRFHMGPYETDDWKMYDRAIKKYENVLWTHHADMLASKVDDI